MKEQWDESIQKEIDDFIKNNSGIYVKNTRDTYLLAINQYINLVGPLDELTNDNLDLFIQKLREQQKNKTKSIRVKIAALKSYVKYKKARKCWYKPSLLSIPLISDTPYHAVPLTSYDWYQITQLTKDHLRNACIFAVFYCTGIRVSELINVRTVDVNLDDRQIWIRKGKNNTERFVPITYKCKIMLEKYLSERTDSCEYLFITRHKKPFTTRQGIWKIIKSYCQEGDISPKISPHTFRRNFAKRLIRKGVPLEIIRVLMGHVLLKTTKIYASQDDEQMLTEYNKFYTR